MADRTGMVGGVDRGRLTLAAYGLLLVAVALPAWAALGGVLVLFFGDDEEFGHSLLLLSIFGPVLLAIALAASVALVMVLRRRSASYVALLGWSGLAMVATFLALWRQGLFDFSSINYQYVLESINVRAVAVLFVLAALVLVSALVDARVQARS